MASQKERKLPNILDMSRIRFMGFLYWINKSYPNWFDWGALVGSRKAGQPDLDFVMDPVLSNAIRDGSVERAPYVFSHPMKEFLEHICKSSSVGAVLHPFGKVFDPENDFAIVRPTMDDMTIMGSCESSFTVGEYRQPLPVMTVELPPQYVPIIDRIMGCHISAYYMTVSHVPGQDYISCIYWNGDYVSAKYQSLGYLSLDVGESGPTSTVSDLLKRDYGGMGLYGLDRPGNQIDYVTLVTSSCLNYLFLSNLTGVEKVKTKPNSILMTKYRGWKRKKRDKFKYADASAALAAPSVLYRIKNKPVEGYGLDGHYVPPNGVMDPSLPFPKTGNFRKDYYGSKRTKYRWSFRQPYLEPIVSVIKDLCKVKDAEASEELKIKQNELAKLEEEIHAWKDRKVSDPK